MSGATGFAGPAPKKSGRAVNGSVYKKGLIRGHHDGICERSAPRAGWGIMKAGTITKYTVSLVIGFMLALPATAQEGHPMSGSWIGDWGPSKDQRTRVVVVMQWTGKELVATINPGPNAIPVKVAKVNPDDWSLHIEAEGKDGQGRPVAYVIDGTIDDLGTYNRSIAGTWNAGAVKGDFSITRQ
jgi:hypothetical protein